MSNAVKIKRVTLKAVAQAAGVSLPTASQILNNKVNNYCSAEKKRLVRQVAKELNYQPNFGYKVMCGQRTNTIGLICSSHRTIHDEPIKDLLLNLMVEFEKLGHSVYTSVMGDSAEDNVTKIISLINRGCSGFVLLGAPFGETEIENIFIQNNIDYLSYSMYCGSRRVVLNTSCVAKYFINNFLEEGRDNFKLMVKISPNEPYSAFQGLLSTFPGISRKKLMDQYVIQLKLTHFNNIENAFQVGYEKTRKLIENDPDIRGIIYHTDYFAIGGAKYLSEKGYKIGADIKLCGYNNTEAVRLAPWPINTADHDVKNICRVIIKQLFKEGPFEIIVKPEIIVKV
jgi:LacI family transcriptional regulator, galactose operon repressor